MVATLLLSLFFLGLSTGKPFIEWEDDGDESGTLSPDQFDTFWIGDDGAFWGNDEWRNYDPWGNDEWRTYDPSGISKWIYDDFGDFWADEEFIFDDEKTWTGGLWDNDETWTDCAQFLSLAMDFDTNMLEYIKHVDVDFNKSYLCMELLPALEECKLLGFPDLQSNPFLGFIDCSNTGTATTEPGVETVEPTSSSSSSSSSTSPSSSSSPSSSTSPSSSSSPSSSTSPGSSSSSPIRYKTNDCIFGLSSPTTPASPLTTTPPSTPSLATSLYKTGSSSGSSWKTAKPKRKITPSHQRNFSTPAKSFHCSKDEFACPEKCIPLAWVCDGKIHCSDQSDESYCFQDYKD